jgi:hypothetical protein
MKHLHLQIYAGRYAELRQALGFKFRERGLVQQFVDFLESQNCSGPIRTAWLWSGPFLRRRHAGVVGRSGV